jgi:methenyltetrahydromethanopterin cyclohydrolase
MKSVPVLKSALAFDFKPVAATSRDKGLATTSKEDMILAGSVLDAVLGTGIKILTVNSAHCCKVSVDMLVKRSEDISKPYYELENVTKNQRYRLRYFPSVRRTSDGVRPLTPYSTTDLSELATRISLIRP